jgi:hypothetical protein
MIAMCYFMRACSQQGSKAPVFFIPPTSHYPPPLFDPPALHNPPILHDPPISHDPPCRRIRELYSEKEREDEWADASGLPRQTLHATVFRR